MKLVRFSVTGLPRFAAATALSLASLALFAGAAQACEYPEGEQVFSAWNDQHPYVIAPEGDFEGGGAGWTLAGGAAVVEGSLSLPEGSSALSPPICTDQASHQLRLFALNSGDPSARLSVDVLRDGRSHPAGSISGEGAWAPSGKLPLGGPAGTAQVLLTPGAGSSWLVDDVYIDPFARH
jgi:hypothetical protein